MKTSLTVLGDINLLTQHQTRIQIVHVQGRTSERLNEVFLHRRNIIFAAQVSDDARLRWRQTL